MDGLYNEILLSITGLGITGLGVGIKYMITRLQEVVPRDEIKDMIATQLEKSVASDESIMSRLSRIENQLDSLVDHLLKDAVADGSKR